MSNGVAVVILAGGEGSRIGGAKPLRMLAGERLIDRALRWAGGRSEVIAVAARRETQVPGIAAEIIADNPRVVGPLSGLMSALRFAQGQGKAYALTIPADMPFLPNDLLRRLHGAIGGHACALASSNGRLHPVCGLWRVSALEQVNAYLATERRSLKGFAEMLGCVAVEWPGEPSDPFFNINSAADLDLAERRAAGSEV